MIEILTKVLFWGTHWWSMTRLRQKKPGKDVGGGGEEAEMKTQRLEKDNGGAEREMKKLEKRKVPNNWVYLTWEVTVNVCTFVQW